MTGAPKHPIEKKIGDFLASAAAGERVPDPALVEEFGERCKAFLVKFLYPTKEKLNEPFRLRMSNIGKSARSLVLEKRHGRPPQTPEFLMKMLYGGMYEEVFMHIMLAAGVNFQRNVEVSLQIAGEEVKGELDCLVTDEDSYGVYDIKTASPYSYENKFVSFDAIRADDGFGYVGQGFGYGKAINAPFRGWIPIHKVTGEWRVTPVPQTNYAYLEHCVLQELEKTIDLVKKDIAPPCRGLTQELFYGKPTGNTIIGKSCQFCNHKEKCHPTARQEPCKVSKAKVKPLKWYVK